MHITFHNDAGFDVQLTIEAPIGMPKVGPPGDLIRAGEKDDFEIGGSPYLSARLIVKAGGEGEHDATQEFILAEPAEGGPIYLDTIDATYDVTIAATVTAKTG